MSLQLIDPVQLWVAVDLQQSVQARLQRVCHSPSNLPLCEVRQVPKNQFQSCQKPIPRGASDAVL